jgi:hypothetical protein
MAEAYETMDIPPNKTLTSKVNAQCDFLAAYVRQAGVTLACGIANRTIAAFTQWRNEDPIFQRCFAHADTARTDTLVFEARRRAVDGVPQTVRDKQGNIIGYDQKYDTPLLVKLLQGLDPEGRFRNKTLVAENAQGAGWRTALAKLMDKDPDAVALLDALADKMVGEDQPASSG